MKINFLRCYLLIYNTIKPPLIILIFIYLIKIIVNNIIFATNIFNIINKVVPTKYNNSFKNIFENYFFFSSSFIYVLLIIHFLLLLFIISFNIYIAFELSSNLDNYVTVYNLIKG